MADDLKKPFFPRQINFATLVLGFLLLFSFTPLTAFSFFTLNGILTQLFPQMRWVLDDGCYLAEANDNPTAFQDFPGLKQIFASKKTAIGNIADQKMAWIPFLHIDNHDAVRFFNPAAERIFGYTRDEMQLDIRKSLAEFWRTGHGPIIKVVMALR